MSSLYYRKDGLFLPLGAGGGDGGGDGGGEGGDVPFNMPQPIVNLDPDAPARSTLSLYENENVAADRAGFNSIPYGSLMLLFLMWRATAAQITPQSETYNWNLVQDSVLQLGFGQNIHLYSKVKPDWHVSQYHFQGPNQRCCGGIVGFPHASRWHITDIRQAYASGETCEITTLANRVNVCVPTWIYNRTSGVVDQKLEGTQSRFVRATGKILQQGRMSIGLVTGETVVRSYNNAESTLDPPNHGILCVSLRYTAP